MKPTMINVQITKCPKQFEAVRLGMDASLDAGETIESAIKAATEQLNAIYAEMYAPQQKVAQNAEKAATNGSKEVLTFEDKRTQQICDRIDRADTIERVKEIEKQTMKYFETTAEAKKAIALAIELKTKLLTNKNN